MNALRRLWFNIRYFGTPPWDTGTSPPELLDFIQTHSPGKALDLGCGTATNIITLTEHGWTVTGVDYAWRAIRKAHLKIQLAGIHADLHVDDVTRLHGINGPFDLILDIGCFHNLAKDARLAYINNVDRLLAINGTYLLYAHYKKPNKPEVGVDEHDLREIAGRLTTTNRKECTDRGRYPSVWLTFTKLPE